MLLVEAEYRPPRRLHGHSTVRRWNCHLRRRRTMQTLPLQLGRGLPGWVWLHRRRKLRDRPRGRSTGMHRRRSTPAGPTFPLERSWWRGCTRLAAKDEDASARREAGVRLWPEPYRGSWRGAPFCSVCPSTWFRPVRVGPTWTFIGHNPMGFHVVPAPSSAGLCSSGNALRVVHCVPFASIRTVSRFFGPKSKPHAWHERCKPPQRPLRGRRARMEIEND